LTPPRQGNAFSRLFSTTLSDLKQVPSKENLLILGIGGVAAGIAHPSDGRVSTSFSGTSSLRSTFSPGQVIGGMATQMAAAIATKAIGNATGNQKVAALGSDLVRAQILTQIVTQGIKFSVQRTRPDGTQYSFPSGHTATSFATATVLQRHFGWKAGVPAYALAAYVAGSRVQMKRHYLSDVTMGAAIGIMGGRSVTVGRGDARFALAPAAVPGGAAVQFSWLGRQ
jgi:membrane-associated phospholipid phosphatase